MIWIGLKTYALHRYRGSAVTLFYLDCIAEDAGGRSSVPVVSLNSAGALLRPFTNVTIQVNDYR